MERHFVVVERGMRWINCVVGNVSSKVGAPLSPWTFVLQGKLRMHRWRWWETTNYSQIITQHFTFFYLDVVVVGFLDNLCIIGASHLDVPNTEIKVGPVCQQRDNLDISDWNNLIDSIGMREMTKTFPKGPPLIISYTRTLSLLLTTSLKICLRENVSGSVSFRRPACSSKRRLSGSWPPKTLNSFKLQTWTLWYFPKVIVSVYERKEKGDVSGFVISPNRHPLPATRPFHRYRLPLSLSLSLSLSFCHFLYVQSSFYQTWWRWTEPGCLSLTTISTTGPAVY